jgi:hypothetical protein
LVKSFPASLGRQKESRNRIININTTTRTSGRKALRSISRLSRNIVKITSRIAVKLVIGSVGRVGIYVDSYDLEAHSGKKKAFEEADDWLVMVRVALEDVTVGVPVGKRETFPKKVEMSRLFCELGDDVSNIGDVRQDAASVRQRLTKIERGLRNGGISLLCAERGFGGSRWLLDGVRAT